MGEVWRARDSKLGREVAIKTLPEEFAKDEERLARFEREAKLLASLNHPNIATIHGLEEDNGTRFLVLELVEGDTLADRLRKGAMPVGESLRLALQIAEALEAAHEKGVIHRDLKPLNIKVTPDGKVKVLDFGLAKAFGGDGTNVNLSQSPTLSMAATQQGVILGTAAYMSPEQASGEEVDKRTDIWAFGCCLYEMLTGQPLFDGRTATHVLAAVIQTEPDWDRLGPATPFLLKHLLRRCLAKDKAERLRDIADARFDLEQIQSGRGSPEPVSTTVGFWRPAAITLAVSLAVVSGFAVVASRDSSPATDTVIKSMLPLSAPIGHWQSPPISPDGRKVAYVRNGRLFIQSLDSLDPVEITATRVASFPFWSPDSEYVGYFEAEKLMYVSADGGPASELVDARGSIAGATWAPDGRIVFGEEKNGLSMVSFPGGDATLLIGKEPEELFVGNPQFLPDGNSLLHSVRRADGTAQVVVQTTKGRIELFETTDIAVARYSPSGHILYQNDWWEGNIWAVPFDAATFEITGERFLVAESGYMPSVSSNGTLVYRTYAPSEQLVWLDRSGDVLDAIGQPHRAMWQPAVSPDGGRIALQGQNSRINDIYVHSTIRSGNERFTTTPSAEYEPEWSPSGDELAFASNRNGTSDIFIRSLSGLTSARALVVGPADFRAPDWSSDGSLIAYHALDPDVGNHDVWYTDVSGDSEPVRFLNSPFDEMLPTFSPDGRYLAYQSNEPGTTAVYIAEFPSGANRRIVSPNAGVHPVWRGDELFYLEGNTLMSVPIQTEPVLDFADPMPLFSTEAASVTPKLNWSLKFPTYDVDLDGQRFVFVQKVPQAGEGESNIVVVQNWSAEFQDQD